MPSRSSTTSARRRVSLALSAALACGAWIAPAVASAAEVQLLRGGDRLIVQPAAPGGGARVAIERAPGAPAAPILVGATRRAGHVETTFTPVGRAAARASSGAAALHLVDGRVVASASPARLVADDPPATSLVVRGVSRPGTTNHYYLRVLDAVTHAWVLDQQLDGDDGAAVPLAVGRYDLLAIAVDGDDVTTAMALLGVEVTTDGGSAVLDTTPGQPIAITLPRAAAPETFEVALHLGNDVQTMLGAVSASPIRVVPMAAAPGHDFRIDTKVDLAAPAAGPAATSRYHLAFAATDAIPEPSYTVTDDDLGVVQARYLTQGRPARGGTCHFSGAPESLGSACTVHDQDLPGEVTEYFTRRDGLAWQSQLDVRATLGDASPGEDLIESDWFVPGGGPAASETTWNRAPLTPTLRGGSQVNRWVDTLNVNLSLLAPADDVGHVTWAYTGGAGPGGVGTTTLRRGAEVIGASTLPGSGSFDLPPDDATYTLEVTQEHVVPWSAYGSHVEAAWTFRSSTTDDAQPVDLLVVRANAEVDDDGVVHAGDTFPLALIVDGQGANVAPERAALDVEVSFDDGATWATAPVTDGLATVAVPAGLEVGLVSLRLHANDGAGHRVDETILRSFGYQRADVDGAVDCTCRIGRAPAGAAPGALAGASFAGLAALVLVGRRRRRASSR